MAEYNHIIEDWWRHNGLWDREQASGYKIKDYADDTVYLEATDEWWESLSYEQKAQVYEDFFNENM